MFHSKQLVHLYKKEREKVKNNRKSLWTRSILLLQPYIILSLTLFFPFFTSLSNQITIRVSFTHYYTMPLIMKLENKKEHTFYHQNSAIILRHCLIKSLTKSFFPSSPCHIQTFLHTLLAQENKWIEKPFLSGCQITYNSQWLVIICRREC